MEESWVIRRTNAYTCRKSHGAWQLIRISMNAVCFLYYNKASLK